MPSLYCNNGCMCYTLKIASCCSSVPVRYMLTFLSVGSPMRYIFILHSDLVVRRQLKQRQCRCKRHKQRCKYLPGDITVISWGKKAWSHCKTGHCNKTALQIALKRSRVRGDSFLPCEIPTHNFYVFFFRIQCFSSDGLSLKRI